MPDDEVTNPALRIPSAAGVVGSAGKQPELPIYLDMNRDGIRDAEQRWFWHGLAGIAYGVVGAIWPKATETQVLKAAQPQIDDVIDRMAK